MSLSIDIVVKQEQVELWRRLLRMSLYSKVKTPSWTAPPMQPDKTR